MTVEAIAPDVETDVLLAGAQFSDAFRIALAGRVYLAVILPFHRLVVRTLLRQVAG